MIVVPIGDEVLSFRALNVAVDMAKKLGEEILVISSLYGGEKTTAEEISRYEVLLDKAVEYASKNGVKVTKRLLIRGKTAGEDIVEVAEEVDAKMIVMGCGIVEIEGELMLRKTTEYVVLHAKRPLLLVK